MTTYSDLEPFIDAGATTAAEIKTAMDAVPLYKNNVWATSSALDQTDVFDILDSNGLIWVQADAEYWHGPLVDEIALINDPVLTQGFGRLLNQLQLNDRIVKCAELADIAILLTNLTNLSKNILPDKAATIQAEMDSITGGLLWSDVSEADVQAILDQKVADDLRAAKSSIINYAVGVEQSTFEGIEGPAKTTLDNSIASARAIYDSGVVPARSRYNTAVSWLSSYDILSHTEEEIRTYASGVLNSSDGVPPGASGNPVI